MLQAWLGPRRLGNSLRGVPGQPHRDHGPSAWCAPKNKDPGKGRDGRSSVPERGTRLAARLIAVRRANLRSLRQGAGPSPAGTQGAIAEDWRRRGSGSGRLVVSIAGRRSPEALGLLGDGRCNAEARPPRRRGAMGGKGGVVARWTAPRPGALGEPKLIEGGGGVLVGGASRLGAPPRRPGAFQLESAVQSGARRAPGGPPRQDRLGGPSVEGGALPMRCSRSLVRPLVAVQPGRVALPPPAAMWEWGDAPAPPKAGRALDAAGRTIAASSPSKSALLGAAAQLWGLAAPAAWAKGGPPNRPYRRGPHRPRIDSGAAPASCKSRAYREPKFLFPSGFVPRPDQSGFGLEDHWVWKTR